MVYTLFKKKEGKQNFRLNTAILTKLKLQSINNVSLTDRESNKLRGDTIWLGQVPDQHYHFFYACPHFSPPQNGLSDLPEIGRSDNLVI